MPLSTVKLPTEQSENNKEIACLSLRVTIREAKAIT